MLNGSELLAALRHSDPRKRLVVSPDPDPALVLKDGRIDLHLSSDVIEFTDASSTSQFRKRNLDGGRHVLAPAKFALCSSEEYVELPLAGLTGQVIGKPSLGRLGLVMASRGQVDPGYRGRLTLEVVNMGFQQLSLTRGQPAAQLIISGNREGNASRENDPFHAPAEAQQTDLLLSFTEDGVELVVGVDTGQVVRGPGTELFDVIAGTPLFATALLPALKEFEDLVNSIGATEADVQRFLERYPEFLTGFDYVDAVPHVVLELEAGVQRVPDFVLRPAGTDPCDLLEIKRPDAKVVTEVAGRPILSRTAAAGVAQLQEYSDVLRSDAVRERVRNRYGLEIVYPRLQLVVGRIRGTSAAAIRRAAWTTGVDIRTYDSLLARARLQVYRRPNRRDLG